MPLKKEYIAHVISFIYKKNIVAKQGLLFLLGENQKKGKRDREAFSVGIAGAKASAIRATKAWVRWFRRWKAIAKVGGVLFTTLLSAFLQGLTNKGVDFITELPGQANEQLHINNGRRTGVKCFFQESDTNMVRRLAHIVPLLSKIIGKYPAFQEAASGTEAPFFDIGKQAGRRIIRGWRRFRACIGRKNKSTELTASKLHL